MKMPLIARSHATIAAASVAGLLLGLATSIAAAGDKPDDKYGDKPDDKYGDKPGEKYVGCLTPGGTIIRVGLGGPLGGSCPPNHRLVTLGGGATPPTQPQATSACYTALIQAPGPAANAYTTVMAIGLQRVGKITTSAQEQLLFDNSQNQPQVGHAVVGKLLAASNAGADRRMNTITGSVVFTDTNSSAANTGAMMQIVTSPNAGEGGGWYQCTSKEASPTPATWSCSEYSVGGATTPGSYSSGGEQNRRLWTRVDTLPPDASANALCGGFLVLPDDVSDAP